MNLLAKLSLYVIFFCSINNANSVLSQCSGGTSAGTLTPTTVFQTVNAIDGRYFQINVTCGRTYTFDFCANGGSAGSLFPEITILNSTGTVQLAFSGYVGGCSQLAWTASFTGSIRVLITDSGCGTSASYSGTMAYKRTNTLGAGFTMTGNCGGASATITGAPGGTFSWNPSPGVGPILNATTGIITNATPGATYTVLYTNPCGVSSSQSVTIPVTPINTCWTLNGNAINTTIGGNNCIQLTPAANGQLGCAWNGSLIDFASSFSLSLDYYFGNSIIGADGSTFTFQPNASTACGAAGGSLGAGGLTNALSIEFDTYDNDNPAHIFDILADHIAVEIDGNHTNGAPFCGPVPAKPSGANIDDGVVYPVNLQWNAVSQTLSIYFNGALRLSCTYDFVTNVFGGNSQVYWGATAATGGLNNQQYFCPQTVIILPTLMTSFSQVCEKEKIKFYWETASERDVDYFVVEETRDGTVFFPLGKVDAIGNSEEVNSYSLVIEQSSDLNRYYRIKSFDNDGSFQASELIAGQNCSSASTLIKEFILTDDYLSIEASEPIVFHLTNQLGQTISNSSVYADNLKTSLKTLSPGVYYIRCIGISGKTEVKKFIISKN